MKLKNTAYINLLFSSLSNDYYLSYKMAILNYIFRKYILEVSLNFDKKYTLEPLGLLVTKDGKSLIFIFFIYLKRKNLITSIYLQFHGHSF